jgi:hypothetical protein
MSLLSRITSLLIRPARPTGPRTDQEVPETAAPLPQDPGGRDRAPPAAQTPPRAASPEEMLAELLELAGEGVGLHGTLDTISVEQLIEMVHSNHRSGRLWVRTATELFEFHLHQGRIARLRSTGGEPRAERLGEVLVELGFVAPEIIDEQLAGPTDLSRPLGVRLLEAGHLTREQLHEAIAVQTVSRLLRAIEAGRTGVYAFKRATWDLGGPPGDVAVDAFELLEDLGAEVDGDAPPKP